MQLVSEEKCYVCGKYRSFLLFDNALTVRESATCADCSNYLRANDVLHALYKTYSATSKDELLDALRGKKILNAAFTGAVHDLLCGLDGYLCSEYTEGVRNGAELFDGVLCVDLCDIPFPDDYFDLILSEHVLEHVPDAKKAFSEIARVLKPGASHLFSIPLSECLHETRCRSGMRKVFHGSLTDPLGALVHYEFGRDILAFSKTEWTYTIPVHRHLFYDDNEVTDLEKDYSDFMLNAANLVYIFKYNPAVFAQIKAADGPVVTDLKMGACKQQSVEFGAPGVRCDTAPLFHPSLRPFTQELFRHLKPGGRVLEFKPGMGALTRYLAEEMRCTVDIVGTDAENAAYARQYAADAYIGRTDTDAWSAYFKAHPYDAIYITDALASLHDPAETLRRCAGLLKDDGFICIVYPSIAHAAISTGPNNDAFSCENPEMLDQDYARLFCGEDAAGVYKNTGLSPVYEVSRGFPVQPDDTIEPGPDRREMALLLHKHRFRSTHQRILVLKKTDSVRSRGIVPECKREPVTFPFGCYYLDLGGGFSEKSCVPCQVTEDDITESGVHFRLNVPLPKEAVAIRFDPTENAFCMATNLQITSSHGSLAYQVQNGVADGDCVLLSNADPQIVIPFPPKLCGRLKCITLEGEFLMDAGEWYVPALLQRRKAQLVKVPRPEKRRLSFGRVRSRVRALLSAVQPGASQEVRHVVDDFDYADGILSVRGWIYDERGNPADVALVFEPADGHAVSHPMVYPVARPDCAAAFDDGNALNVGFEGRYAVRSGAAIQVYLAATLQGTPQRIYLGTLDACQPAQTQQIAPMADTSTPILDPLLMRAEKAPFSAYPPGYLDHTVDIIVPVYNGHEHLDTLFEGLTRTAMRYRLILIDDASTDDRVWPGLQRIAQSIPGSVLLKNETNLGYVRTVNRALATAQHDVVIVTTDVELPAQWLERLMYPLIEDEGVATVTAYTAEGITAFPVYTISAEEEPHPLIFSLMSAQASAMAASIPEGLSIDEIDLAFSSMRPKTARLPAGSGFCMAMRKKALDAVGLFDTEFGMGYGEDVDWCMRATKAGFSHALADNVYIRHRAGGSFPAVMRKHYATKNEQIISTRYPAYQGTVALYLARDAQKNVRDFLFMRLCNGRAGKRPVALFDTADCNSDSPFCEKYYESWSQDRGFLQFMPGAGQVRVRYRHQEVKLHFDLIDPGLAPVLLDLLGVDELYVGRLGGGHGMRTLLGALAGYVQRGAVKATAVLLNHEFALAEWRADWDAFLSHCDAVWVFSAYAAAQYRALRPSFPPPTVKPLRYHLPRLNTGFRRQRLRIGVLDVSEDSAAVGILRQMLAEIQARGLGCELVLFGAFPTIADSPHVLRLPACPSDGLPRQILAHEVDLLLDPAVDARVFPCAAAQAMEMNLPFACFDRGAQAELAEKCAVGIVAGEISGPAILEKIRHWYENADLALRPGYEKKVLFLIDDVNATSRYRVEHVMEQLSVVGMAADCVITTQINGPGSIDWGAYGAVVVFRMQFTPLVGELILFGKQNGLPVYFSIDDYIFDFERTKDLPLTVFGFGYSPWQLVSHNIGRTMDACDAHILSTDYLSNAARRFFGKDTHTLRNVYSAEQLSHALRADACIVKKPGTVTLGYYGGAITHSYDFMRIEDVVVRLMQEHAHLHITFIGPWTRFRKLEPFAHRINYYGMRGWRELVYTTATFDFVVMPLRDEPIHLGVSENKWMECGLVGVPAVAQKTPELASVIRHGENGLLCESQADWYENLSRIITDDDLRNRIAQNARAHMLGNKSTLHADADLMHFLLRHFNARPLDRQEDERCTRTPFA